MKALLLIWIGGGIGSVFRYLVQLAVGKLVHISFPAGTMLVNIAGCFIIGLIYALVNKYATITLEWRLFLVTGLCGGFTTFSSFSYECVSLFRQGNFTYFILYILLSMALGLLATLGGLTLIK